MALSNVVAISHIWLIKTKLKINKIKHLVPGLKEIYRVNINQQKA